MIQMEQKKDKTELDKIIDNPEAVQAAEAGANAVIKDLESLGKRYKQIVVSLNFYLERLPTSIAATILHDLAIRVQERERKQEAEKQQAIWGNPQMLNYPPYESMTKEEKEATENMNKLMKLQIEMFEKMGYKAKDHIKIEVPKINMPKSLEGTIRQPTDDEIERFEDEHEVMSCSLDTGLITKKQKVKGKDEDEDYDERGRIAD
jgi:hypothetical protein